MNVTAYFTESDEGKTGLTPTISVVRVSDESVVVNNQSMSPVNNATGWYLFNFAAYDSDEEYICMVDAGTDSVDSRHLTTATATSAEATIDNDAIAATVWGYNG
jgi:hypothetical protein